MKELLVSLALLAYPVSSLSQTAIVVVTFCGNPVYVMSVSDIDGSNQARFGAYKAIKASDEAWALLQRMLADPELDMKKWRIEDELGMKCI